MRSSPWLVAAVTIVLVACGARAEGERGPTARQQQNRITAEEIRTATHSNAYDLVQAYRPQWFRTRGTTSLGFSGNAVVQVYVDNVRHGSVQSLRNVPVASIESMAYMDGVEASSRWGFDHGAGAIMITTRR